MILAVDPGIRGCGVAIFKDGKLVGAKYVKSAAPKGNGAQEAACMATGVVSWKFATFPGERVTELALEWPRIYASRIREGKTKENPNDLLALCGVQSVIAAAYFGAKVTCYAPSDWKGQIDKIATRYRVESRLGPEELAHLDDAAIPSLLHNVYDAIGIGLHHVGRFDRRRVIAA